MVNKTAQNQPKDKNNMTQTTDISPQIEEMGFQMNEEIDRLEEMILDNPRIPFVGRTLIDEDKLINQLDLIRINIPDSLEQALDILRQKQQIIDEAQKYSKKLIENAQQKAAHILDETRIVQQAEAQANQIRRQVQQECERKQQEAEQMKQKVQQEVEQMKQKVQQDITQMKQKVQQDIIQMRQKAILESEDIQNEADDYADSTLSHLEKQLTEMLKIVQNGRKQINHNQSSSPNLMDNALTKKPSP